jgi:2-keto-4-pentenoate hydratase
VAEPRGGRDRRTAPGTRAPLAFALALLVGAALARGDDGAPLTVERAYAIQRETTERSIAGGERVAGYKAAFTSETAQRAMGIASPAYGPLFASMQIESGGALDLPEYKALRAEVEVAFRLGTAISAPLDREALRAAVASLHVALELPDLRLPGTPSAAALIADGVSARHFALGAPHSPAGIDAAGLDCELLVDGALFTRARGNAALGDPWNALAWLVEEHLRRGGRFAAGDVILTGSLGAIWAPGEKPPSELTGRCDRLGEVRVRVAR